MAMALTNLGIFTTPEQMANYSLDNGCRAATGTDMVSLIAKIAKDYCLNMEYSNDINKAIEELNKGGSIVIANVGGDRKNHVGVFSSGGHYIVLQGTCGADLVILDSGYYQGKYSKLGRSGVTVSDKYVLAAPNLVDSDCENRSPRYYILTKKA